eukprot:TRINITY_DN9547_c0_g1_i2.p1 TRINITY_DN9547_c0_g1~~TRINITY_DN9547_c0_g1_i2.p1  ORF type:complete len:384 (+),score=22.68 TRINITY_DN9547_c0_g1_i2:40-1152(+)
MKEGGHDVQVFEIENSIGGTWMVCYPDAAIQSTKDEYQYSDYSHDQQSPRHMNKQQILDYVRGYADRFDLWKFILFRHRVISLISNEHGWELEVLNLENGVAFKTLFDFIIIAQGQFYHNPNIPPIIQQEMEKPTFRGEVFHDRGYVDRVQIKDKRVAVIGFGKAALDIACQVVQENGRVDHVFRQPRWFAPLYIFGLLHYTTVLFSRYGNYLASNWNPSRVQRMISLYLPWLPWLYFLIVQIAIRITLGLYPFHPLAAQDKFSASLRASIAISPQDYMLHYRRGRIRTHQAEVVQFTETGVVLSNGELLEVDTVICATGYRQHLKILPQYQHLMEDDGIYLYRHLIHPPEHLRASQTCYCLKLPPIYHR